MRHQRSGNIFLGHSKSASYQLVASQVDPPLLGEWNLHVPLKEAEYSEHKDKIKDKFQFKLSAESICMRHQ